jgi:hypothetical protein
MTFSFTTSGEDPKESYFIDLSQCASILNRRFYRQGLNWAVSGFKFLTSQGATGQISVSKLPNTWVMSNAWEKGFRSWMQMNKDALEEAPSVKPKFLDFKIYMNEDHYSNGFGKNLLPISSATLASAVQVATPGEWESSKLRIPVGVAAPGDTTEREIMAVGPNFGVAGNVAVVSLIDGYAASRGLPNIQDPNTPGDADDATGLYPDNWMSALQSDGTEQEAAVLTDLTSENNTAPYPFENGPNQAGGTFADTMYPGGANQLSTLQIHDSEFLTSTTVGGTTHLKGGNFPCGLVCLNLGAYDGTTLYMQVDLVPGNHRGYLAEPMTEM